LNCRLEGFGGRSGSDQRSRTLIESGALYPLLTYDQALPLFGIGFAFGLAPMRLAILTILFFVAGLALGLSLEDRLLDFFTDSGWLSALSLLGPLSCVIVGIALISSGSLRAWILAPAAVAFGTAFGFAVGLNDTSIDDWGYATGATITGLWLASLSMMLARRFEGAWIQIAARILGSWLMAIGVMLGGVQLVPTP